MQIEIFERPSGALVETIECEDMKAFRAYWSSQCNGVEYGFRVVGSEAAAGQPRVAKEPVEGEGEVEFLPLTDDLCGRIAAFNGDLTAGQVHHALLNGQTIYTTFARYRLE